MFFLILNIKLKNIHSSAQNPGEFLNLEPSFAWFRLGFGAKMNKARIKTLHVISTVWYFFLTYLRKFTRNDFTLGESVTHKRFLPCG